MTVSLPLALRSRQNEKEQLIRARKEAILAAGALRSPAILKLSGSGIEGEHSSSILDALSTNYWQNPQAKRHPSPDQPSQRGREPPRPDEHIDSRLYQHTCDKNQNSSIRLSL